jgi:hypothetical protein
LGPKATSLRPAPHGIGIERAKLPAEPGLQTSRRLLNESSSQTEPSAAVWNVCGPRWNSSVMSQPTWLALALATTSVEAWVWPNLCVPSRTMTGLERTQAERFASLIVRAPLGSVNDA